MARPVGRRLDAWWRGLSGPARFRLYTRVTLQVSALVVAASMGLSLAAQGASAGAVAGIIATALLTVAAFDARHELATGTTARLSPRLIGPLLAGFGLIWCAAVVARYTGDPQDPGPRVCLVVAVMAAMLAIVAFDRRRIPAILVVCLVTGALLSDSFIGRLTSAVSVTVLGMFVLATVELTRWSLRMVEDLERAKHAEAQLRVAEERLGFARDLHDVVGRAFATIAVKSELAATLTRSGANERATDEMVEVHGLAVSSMEEMRSLVRGYRAPDLTSEVAGSRSLLAAAGCTLQVEGAPGAVPADLHEVAAWVVREGTTNIVRHSAATSATLSLGESGMALCNNGVQREGCDENSGLRGLRERLAAVGATLETATDLPTFALQVRWRTP